MHKHMAAIYSIVKNWQKKFIAFKSQLISLETLHMMRTQECLGHSIAEYNHTTIMYNDKNLETSLKLFQIWSNIKVLYKKIKT